MRVVTCVRRSVGDARVLAANLAGLPDWRRAEVFSLGRRQNAIFLPPATQ
jgi:hypothetical protein